MQGVKLILSYADHARLIRRLFLSYLSISEWRAQVESERLLALPTIHCQPVSARHKSRVQGKAAVVGASYLKRLHPATIFKTPENPRATFEGLPAELRLQIYGYLGESLLIHVHKRIKKNQALPPFTWTPCCQPNPKTPLLCANPEWSSMCKEQDRCTREANAPLQLQGSWALAVSNKAIRNESLELFLRGATVSVHWDDLHPWLDHLIVYAP
jgi:hypothetical protein